MVVLGQRDLKYGSPQPRVEEALEILQWPGVSAAGLRKLLRGTGDGLDLRSRALARFKASYVDTKNAEGNAHRILEQCGRLGVEIFLLGCEGYPRLLADTPDPPPLLFVRGSLGVATSIAVVGTRKASKSGMRIARTISSFLARRGITVVSGLAIGIDTSAHAGALDGNGGTVAVLAHGLHDVLPARNRELAERILATGGALVSEHPPGVPAIRAEFVRRNRIQSGMSAASVVVESDVEGGSIHHARFAARQGHRILTVLAATDASRGDLNESGARFLIDNLKAVQISTTAELGREIDALNNRLPVDCE